MFIEDDELRALYQASSAEHLEKIESGLIQLEKSPDDAETLNAVLRSMHSLKGDSRMLGVEDAEKVVHQMEDLLIEVQQGKASLTSGLCDRLYKGLDATQKMATEAVGGEPANLNLFFVLAGLMADAEEAAETETLNPESADTIVADFPAQGEGNPLDDLQLQDAELLAQARMQIEQQLPDPMEKMLEEAAGVSDADLNQLIGEPQVPDTKLDQLLGDSFAEADLEPISSNDNAAMQQLLGGDEGDNELQSLLADDDDEPEVSQEVVIETKAESKKSAAKQYQIESVRVAANKLDNLMNQADELTVTKLGIARRQEDLAEVYRLWEDWSRELSLLNVSNNAISGSGVDQQSFLRMTQERLEKIGEALVNVRYSSADDLARLESVSQSLESGIRNLRLLPLSSIFNVLPRMVRDLSREQGKNINFVIEGGDTLVDKRILEELKDPLTHLIRNAVDHGIESLDERLAQGKSETATIRLRGFQTGDRIGLELVDDGQGLDVTKITQTALKKGLHTEAELNAMSTAQIQNLIFSPGFTTKGSVTSISGRGVGLDVVRSNVQRLKGSLEVESVPGQGCQFKLLLNSNLASTHALIIKVQEETFALPIEAVETLMLLERDDLFTFDGQLAIRWEGQPTSVQWLGDLLNLDGETPQAPPSLSQLGRKIPCILMKLNGVYLGLLVDQLIDQEYLVLKPKSQFLSQVPNVRGAAILGSGDICMILEPNDLLRAAQGEPHLETLQELLEEETTPQILLVEDSLVIRTQMIRILSNAGYEVTAAVDGKDGLEKLETGTFQAIVSDVEMPNLSGLEMTQTIRQSQVYNDLPIILVTTLAKEEDKQRGADAGANAYLTKGDFDQTLLLNTLRRLI